MLNRNEMIDLLIDNDIDRFYNNDSPADVYAYHRRVGFIGYENMPDNELYDELIDRQIIEENENA